MASAVEGVRGLTCAGLLADLVDHEDPLVDACGTTYCRFQYRTAVPHARSQYRTLALSTTLPLPLPHCRSQYHTQYQRTVPAHPHLVAHGCTVQYKQVRAAVRRVCAGDSGAPTWDLLVLG
eukprot:3941397-Rhodomonas_salina.1